MRMYFITREPNRCVFCAFRAWNRPELATTRYTGWRHLRLCKVELSKNATRYYATEQNVDKEVRGERILRMSTRNRRQELNKEQLTWHRRQELNKEQLYQLFVDQFYALQRGSEYNKTFREETESWGVTNRAQLHARNRDFLNTLEQSYLNGGTTSNNLFFKLEHAFLEGGIAGLIVELKRSLVNLTIQRNVSNFELFAQKKAADLRYPLEWFPGARAMQRKIHLHVGPTNSGKTYQALRRLEEAETGIYAGPLRLLAHEVYKRLNASGKLCALVTGEERRIPEGLETVMCSCTVEMVNLNTKVDVAVIDEIQMMGDEERGWAWTHALLGIKAKEVHLCGEERTVPLIRDLCGAMGDTLEIHSYKRLSPLRAMESSLEGDLTKLQKGDAVISFSRVGIHALKHEIERITRKRCAIVYGSLPPETRAQQANLFNDPNNDYDFLVASDAIGMGLNLSIKRVIFETTSKMDGPMRRPLKVSAIKQIGGRAGRYKTAGQEANASLSELPTKQSPSVPQSIGYVTAFHDHNFRIVKSAMSKNAPPLTTAGIFPPTEVILRFAAYFPPATPISFILNRLYELCTTHPRFHMCNLDDNIRIADIIQPYNLTILDRLIFTKAPARIREKGMQTALRLFARCVAQQSGGELLDLPGIDLEVLDEPENQRTNKEYLHRLESLHKVLTLYMWLSYRFAGIFRSRALCFHVKSLVEERINTRLSEINPAAKKYKALGGDGIFQDLGSRGIPSEEMVGH